MVNLRVERGRIRISIIIVVYVLTTLRSDGWHASSLPSTLRIGLNGYWRGGNGGGEVKLGGFPNTGEVTLRFRDGKGGGDDDDDDNDELILFKELLDEQLESDNCAARREGSVDTGGGGGGVEKS